MSGRGGSDVDCDALGFTLLYFLSFFLFYFSFGLEGLDYFGNVSDRAALHGMYTWSVWLYNGGFRFVTTLKHSCILIVLLSAKRHCVSDWLVSSYLGYSLKSAWLIYLIIFIVIVTSRPRIDIKP